MNGHAGESESRRNYDSAVFRLFLRLFLLSALLVSTVLGIHYYTSTRFERLALEASEKRNVELAGKTLANDLKVVCGDLLFVAKLNELRRMLNRPVAQARSGLIEELRHFAAQKGWYDQIRYLDENGRELVRINYNGGAPLAIPKEELQDKSQRYYVRKALLLEAGQVYISPFDLNIEQGRIEQPLKPVLRFATPLFNDQGERRGVLIFNMLGRKLIDDFRGAATHVADHIMLVNGDGFWLSSPNPEDEWGFLLPHERSFARQESVAWHRIQRHLSGQFQTGNGLFTYITIDPLDLKQPDEPAAVVTDSAERGRHWKVIAHLPPTFPGITAGQFARRNFPLYAIIALILFAAAWFLARVHVRQQFSEDQREYEHRFRNTLETIQLAAISLDATGRITFCNDFFLKQIGFKRKELLGKDWFEILITPESRRSERGLFQGIIDAVTAMPATHENHLVTYGGAARLFEWTYTPSRDAHGTIVGITAIGQDITEKRRTETELRKLSRAVEQSPSTVMITNIQGQIEYVNPKFTQLTGYTLEEVKGENPKILKSGETAPETYRDLWATITRGEEWRGELRNRNKEGELYWEYTIISPIRDPEGNITHFIAVKEDITERKRLEKEIEARNRELVRTHALAVMGRMASMIAHDLRNPLSSIKMGIQILGRQAAGDNSEARELKDIALTQVQYMEDILEDMLQYSRPDALKPEWLSINKTLDMATALTEKAIRERHARISTEYHPQLPTLHGDPTKLRQIFSNLIMNALQATDNTGRRPEIHIRTELELESGSPCIRVAICDNGPGIDPAAIDKFFEPFFTTRTKGTGLGLAIVRRFVEQHSGRVHLARATDGGTCAVVIIPTGPVSA